MKKSYRAPIILLAVFAALLAFVLIRDRVTPVEEEGDGVVEVLALDPSLVTSAVFQYDDTTVEVVKEGDLWNMRQPEEAEARPEKMNDLLSEFEEVMSTGEPLGVVEELADYGLVDPSLVVTLNSDEETRTLTFGDRDFTGSSVYGMVDGDDRVHLLPAQLFAMMQVDPEGLRKDTTETSEE